MQQNNLDDEIRKIKLEIDKHCPTIRDIKREGDILWVGITQIDTEPTQDSYFRILGGSSDVWFSQALRSIAEKTVEAVRVEEDSNIGDTIAASGGAYEPSEEEIALEEGFSQAVDKQTKLAEQWLGKDK